ncbi:hypothetical protein FGW20_02120 [Methanoculleus sp. FWC-SCC3]|uniref:Uncharacterized protein n=1 Tax=Methanoculleus methanifontis TaxID=2584086 RepID=A0ABT8LZI6_9EURY|nr:hypothetical protein [Methanoculleus sp. FWC-SCC3]MDN7011858.1 hypothetical protein [Methanoculleus sp. FWC-SCC3]
MRRKVSMDTLLTGLFVVMLLLLLFYDPIRRLHPALDPLLMLSGQAIGLVLLALMVFCIVGLVLLVIRRLYGVCRNVARKYREA